MSEERLWTEEEQLNIELAACSEFSDPLLELLIAERRRAIDFAWGLWQDTFAEGAGAWRSNRAEEIADACAFLHSLGLLEKHPERDWYRWREEK